jgi:hypothetical protein
MGEPPIILRLTLERMEANILQALYPREVELKTIIEQAIQEALRVFDFEAEVRQQVAAVLRSKVAQMVEILLREAIDRKNGSPLEKLIRAEIERQLQEEK